MYLVAGARPENVRFTTPVVPMVAAAGADTVILPAAVLPNSQLNKVKFESGPSVSNPWTQTRYVSPATGLSTFACSFEVAPPVAATTVLVDTRTTMISRSSAPLPSVKLSKSEKRAWVVPAGITKSNETVPGPPATKLLFGSSATVPGVWVAGINPRAVAVHGPV